MSAYTPRRTGTDWMAAKLKDLQRQIDATRGARTGPIHGTGSPEGVVVAKIGELYVDDDGGAGTTLYVKELDSGLDTGWAAK